MWIRLMPTARTDSSSPVPRPGVASLVALLGLVTPALGMSGAQSGRNAEDWKLTTYCVAQAVLPWASHAGKGEAGVKELAKAFADPLSLLEIRELTGSIWGGLGDHLYLVTPTSGSHAERLFVVREGGECAVLGWERGVGYKWKLWKNLDRESSADRRVRLALPDWEVDRRLEIVARWNSFRARVGSLKRDRIADPEQTVRALLRILESYSVADVDVGFVSGCEEIRCSCDPRAEAHPDWCQEVHGFSIEERDGVWTVRATTVQRGGFRTVELWDAVMTKEGMLSVAWRVLAVMWGDQE